MEFGNKKMENTEALDQSRESVEQAEQVDKDTLEGKLSTEQFDDDGDETSDANNPNDEESTDMKVRDTTAPEAAAGKFSEWVEQPEEVSTQGAKDAENAQELSSKEAIETGEAQFDDSDEMDSPDVTDENDSAEIVEKAEEPFDDTADPDTETADTKATNSDTNGTSDIPEETFDDSVEYKQTESKSGDVAEQDKVGSDPVDSPTKEDETFDDSVEAEPSEDSADNKESKADPKKTADEVNEEPFDDSNEAERSTDSIEKAETTSDTNPDGTPKRFEDYSYSELSDMARDNPAKAAELNADFRERYEAEMRGMTQEEYQDYKYRLQAAQSKEELEDTETQDAPTEYQSEKFNSIQQRVEQFRENFDADDTTVSEDKKALGANINTIHDIQSLRTDIGKEKDACMERMGELKQENPYYNPDTHPEYKEVSDRYKALDSADSKLKSWEAELDGKNYALCEKRDLPYYQQTEHYHEPGSYKMDKMESYLHGSDGKPGLRDKLDTGTTEPLDKFQFDFQYERMSSSLSDLQRTGTPDERARAKELSAELNATKTQFDGMYKDYTLKQDGTVTQKTETHESAKKIYSNESIRDDLPNGGSRFSQIEIGAGGKHTKIEQEQYLYTGENTGKASKSVARDGLHIRATSEETGIGRDGTEYKKSTVSDVSLGRVEVGYEVDTQKGEFSAKGNAAVLKGRTETEKGHGEQKTTISAEVNVAHVSGEVSAKVNEGEYGAKIEGAAGDAKLSYEKKNGDQSFGVSVEGKVVGGSASAEFDKFGPDVKVSTYKAEGTISPSVNEVEIAEKTHTESKVEIVAHSPLDDVRNAFKGIGKLEDLRNTSIKEADTDNIVPHTASTRFDISEVAPKLKTAPDTAYFWSGRTDGVGGAENAAEIAKSKGGVTLETTIAEQKIEMPEWDFDNPDSLKAWDEASAAYAMQVSGEVHAVVGENLREGNIWENVELPRLKDNPDVTRIVTIDPKTHIERTIFER